MSNTLNVSFPKSGYCKREVAERETLRLVRGRGFKMHYIYRQCKRRATHGDYCKQHAKAAAK